MKASTIFQHDDYRDFLKECFLDRKEKQKNFSYQSVATKIGTTKSYLKLIVEKKRHMSLDKIHTICDLFSLSEFEQQYLVFLFLKRSVKNKEIREFFKTILASYKATYNRTQNTSIHWASFPTREDNSIFRNWIDMAIQGLIATKDYQHSPSWIQQRLGGDLVLCLEDVKDSLTRLEKDYLVLEEGKWQHKQKGIQFQDVSATDVEDYQRFKTGFRRAEMAIDLRGKTSIHRPNRFHLHCLTLSHEEVNQVIKLYDELDHKLREIANKSEKPERLIFVSNSCFGISEKESNEAVTEIR